MSLPAPELISLVLPVYNEEEVLPLTMARLFELRDKLPCPCELVFVDDGSADDSTRILTAAAGRDETIKVLRFARNFGHQVALTAGLEVATGDVVVAMDADLQDPPDVVLEMLDRYLEGAHVVYAERISRAGEGVAKRGLAALFYWFMSLGVHRDLPRNVGDFRLMSRPALDALLAMPEKSRFLRGMVAWLGFSYAKVQFHRNARAAGEPKYSTLKSAILAWNAITSFSIVPLRMAVLLGGVSMAFAGVYGVYAVVQALRGITVPGWATIVVLQCLFSGAVLLCLGGIGEYIGRVYEELKRRPLYVVEAAYNVGEEAPGKRFLGVGVGRYEG
jgi:dolichol-phosphate mannosyltransferase